MVKSTGNLASPFFLVFVSTHIFITLVSLLKKTWLRCGGSASGLFLFIAFVLSFGFLFHFSLFASIYLFLPWFSYVFDKNMRYQQYLNIVFARFTVVGGGLGISAVAADKN